MTKIHVAPVAFLNDTLRNQTALLNGQEVALQQ
jgi:hypothetical protein